MNKEAADLINKLLEEDQDLTTWEYDFLSSIAEVEGELTARQADKLEEIYQAYLRRTGLD